MVPDGQGGDTRGETIFTFAYWKEFFLNETSSQFQSNLEQTFLA
jgi:hypothetical protein